MTYIPEKSVLILSGGIVCVCVCVLSGTVLANEEIINGLSERGDHPVQKLPIRQWLLKITEYADELEKGLEGLAWPEGTVAAQRSWIGRSEGTLVTFDIASTTEDSKQSFDAFTTRVDTLYGVTYVVLAPEHELVASLTTAAQKEAVSNFLVTVQGLSDLDRTAGTKEPRGVFLGSHAIHPLTNERLPIWIADYVIGGYGTSAVMAVPAHDVRDFNFASKYGLSIKQVIESPSDTSTNLPFTDDGVLVNSPEELNGATSLVSRDLIANSLEVAKKGSRSVSYKLRDWTFSRQRFWGEPIPIYFPVDMEDTNGDPRLGSAHTIRYDKPIPVPEHELPLQLPEMDDFSPGNDPQGCLAKAVDWRYFMQDGKWFARETNTMPQVK